MNRLVSLRLGHGSGARLHLTEHDLNSSGDQSFHFDTEGLSKNAPQNGEIFI